MSAVYDRISRLLYERGIDLFAPIKLSDCKITKKYLLDRTSVSESDGRAIMLAVPYLVNDSTCGNISEYAKSRDYHLFFELLFNELLPVLRLDFPSLKFEGFTDHSPIDEIHAAAAAGLGMIGSNGLLITEKYSSFVFFGEIITDADIPCEKKEIQPCEGCSLCIKACPVDCDKVRCISAITQKKGVLTEEEENLIVSNKTAWGCDICQMTCPHSKKAFSHGTIYSKIPFFNKKRIPFLTYETIDKMPSGEFGERAYSWRGKEVLLRNLSLLEKADK